MSASSQDKVKSGGRKKLTHLAPVNRQRPLDERAPEDVVQRFLTLRTSEWTFESLSAEAVHAAKALLIDTLGVLIGGFTGDPCRLARNLATRIPQPEGATIIGTTHQTTPDLAAFANATTARYLELNDIYHRAGVQGGHPSDVITPVLAAGEYAHATGRDCIAAIALAYDVYLRFADSTNIPGFDASTFSCLSVAIAAGKLLGLTPAQLQHAISMAVVPNNALNVSRTGNLSMWKATAAGQAGRAGIFAALLAREGMEGPSLPFEGKSAWLDVIAHNGVEIARLTDQRPSFRITDTHIKLRPAAASAITPAMAAEEARKRFSSADQIEWVKVEVNKRAAQRLQDQTSSAWNPTNRETADHSIPYVVGVTLHDGRLTPSAFDQEHLQHPDIREIVNRIDVVENQDFTQAFEKGTIEHRARVTVKLNDGTIAVGEASEGLSASKAAHVINAKFTELAEEYLGPAQVRSSLDYLWSLDEVSDVASLPALLVL